MAQFVPRSEKEKINEEIPVKFPKTYAVTSTVMHGGLGLYAGEDIQNGEIIIEYTGKVISYKEARTIKDRTYLKAISFTRHLDGNVDYASNAKYINDHVDKTKHNVTFIKMGKPANRIFVKATRIISKDEELFIDYGRGHWIFHDIGDFLGLELRESRGGKVLAAKEDLDNREVICVYTSRLLDDYYHGLGKHVSFSVQVDLINCVVRKNPFIPGTLMITATRKIKAGEILTADCSCRLMTGPCIVGTGTVGEGDRQPKFSAFAQTDIKSGEILGVFKGRRIKLADFPVEESSEKIERMVKIYDKAIDETFLIDPSDEDDGGDLDSRRTSPVYFVRKDKDMAKINSEFAYSNQLKNTSTSHSEESGSAVGEVSILCLVASKSILRGEEIFVSLETVMC